MQRGKNTEMRIIQKFYNIKLFVYWYAYTCLRVNRLHGDTLQPISWTSVLTQRSMLIYTNVHNSSDVKQTSGVTCYFCSLYNLE